MTHCIVLAHCSREPREDRLGSRFLRCHKCTTSLEAIMLSVVKRRKMWKPFLRNPTWSLRPWRWQRSPSRLAETFSPTRNGNSMRIFMRSSSSRTFWSASVRHDYSRSRRWFPWSLSRHRVSNCLCKQSVDRRMTGVSGAKWSLTRIWRSISLFRNSTRD